MTSSNEPRVRLAKGNILASKAHAIVNTVNCVGIMGKGIALAFKREFPEMYKDYVRRCDSKTVMLGEPYPYHTDGQVVINFPTKHHWRSVSKLDDIENGLVFLREHVLEWGIQSIAVPPLGCGNGQLDWSVVRPVLVKHLGMFPIPVELYVPHDVELGDNQLSLISTPDQDEVDHAHKTNPAMLALVEILRVIEGDSYHWPIGRIMFQKLAYFATAAGIPTQLEYEAGSFGPFAKDLNKHTARLQNNGLVREHQRGRMIEVTVGESYEESRFAIVKSFGDDWHQSIHRVADLMARFDTKQAEVAATVHYTANALKYRFGRRPYAKEVIAAVEHWKVRRRPPLNPDDIGRSIVSLATQGWIDVEADDSVSQYLEEMNSLC